MKIRPLGSELFHTQRQTHDGADRCFSQFLEIA